MKRHYLPIAFELAGHYEIVELLGEDEFEILYLVKDLHMGEKLFVLKELFLPSYTSRNEDMTLNIMAKSKQIFEQTKKDVIDEIEVLKTTEEKKSPELYGYFEENNTLYTIMEFMNDANISPYLELNTSNETEEQVTEEETIEPIVEISPVEKEKPKSTLFLKILIVCVVIFLGLAFYGYQMLQEEKQRIKEKSEQNSVTVIKGSVISHPPLSNRDKKRDEDKKDESLVKTSANETNSSSNESEYIELHEEDEINSDVLAGVPKEEVYQTEDELEEIVATEVESDVFDEEDTFDKDGFEVPSSIGERTNSLLGKRIN